MILIGQVSSTKKKENENKPLPVLGRPIRSRHMRKKTCVPFVRDNLLEMLCCLNGISAIHEGHILLNNFGIRMPILIIISVLENLQDCRSSDASIEYLNHVIIPEPNLTRFKGRNHKSPGL